MSIHHVHVVSSIDIAAGPQQVWSLLTGDISAWWGQPYLLIDGTPTLHVEPHLGGSIKERLGAREASWGTVCDIEPGARIAWYGPMGMGDAVAGTVTITLTPADGGARTTVELRHEAIGAFGEATQASYDYGWDDLLHRLRALAERDEAFGTAGANQAPPEFARERPW